MKRFWSKVRKSNKNECWEWESSKDTGGYGCFWLNGGSRIAHRVAYKLTVGEIPNGLCVLHICDNRACVNPAHLYLGNHADNMADMERRERGNHPAAEQHGMAKLSWKGVGEIRKLGASGMYSLAEIGRKFNISYQHADRIIQRINWR